MENLSDINKVILDKEQKFYTNYLLCYEKIESSDGLVKADEKIVQQFNNFSELYFTSKDFMTEEELKIYEDYVDSFAFYVSIGVIISRNDDYFIDLNALSKISQNYHKTHEEKGNSLTKGTI